MAEEAIGDGARYWAFISYSHKDAAFGRRLHRKLESYVLPRHLTGADKLPRRLVPIFRDREELPAAGDLSAEVRAALAQSRSLIVVCSRDAAASQWVGREVALFRELHPDRPVLAAIRSGEPAECFPQAIHRTGADGAAIEPLAADFRRGRDGEGLGLLKLVAGIAGVGLDALVQRDAQRKFRRVTAVTAAALTAMVVMAALTGYALHARSEAEWQKAEAEGLVEYMLTDLRDKLKGVGRLDVMSAVNQRALQHYAGQDIGNLSTDSLERRARILDDMGEDDEERGNYDNAIKVFRETHRTTAALLAAAPDNPERIYNHAQTEFWLGTVDYRRRRFAAARTSFLAYKQLADRLVALAPSNAKYLKEPAYADENLCVVAQATPPDPPSAMHYCALSLARMEDVARRAGPSNDITDDLTNRHAWLADAYRLVNDNAHATEQRRIEEKMIDGRLASDPSNMDLKESWVTTQRAIAVLEFVGGHHHDAVARLHKARDTIDGMVRYDPSNKRWRVDRDRIDEALATIH